jgi:hypothetical protein
MISARDTLIDAKLDLNDVRLRVRLESMPKQLQKRLTQTIGRLTNELVHKVEAREPVRTGRLRSLTQAYVDTNQIKMFVRGRVRVLRTRQHNTAAAAGALEYGSTGKKFAVKGYMRRGSHVRGYQRVGGITEMRFLRGPAAAMLPKARAELRRVLADVLKD